MENSKIQLCALGNALVDMQFFVSDSMLEKLYIHKGEMRLVEMQEQLSIIKRLENIVPHRCSGGSATNTIDAFAKFGGKAAYLTSVGDDGNGIYYYNELGAINVVFKRNIIVGQPTGTCLILITPDGERSMLTCLAASKSFSLEHLDAELIKSSEWLYVEGYKFSETVGVSCIEKAIEIAKQSKTKIAITASDVFIINEFRSNFINQLRQADLIFCNETEAQAIAESNDPDNAFEKITKIVPNVVMTRGSKGSKILFKGKTYLIPPHEVTVIDTTGAGDMYSGAFLYGLNNFKGDDAVLKAGYLASYSSSIIVSQLGARYKGYFKELLYNSQIFVK